MTLAYMAEPAEPETVAEQFARDGYAFPRRIMSEDAALALRQEFEAIERDHPNPRKPLVAYTRSSAHYVIRFISDIISDPLILDPVSEILGPNLMVWTADIFAKPARSEKYVGWHQDITYWGMGETDHVVTAWIALSPATVESGCMRFVPGSHKQSVVPHADRPEDGAMLSRGQEIAVEVDENDAIPVILRPGEMSLHHGRMFHASGPNHSDDRRIGLAIRYIRPDVALDDGHLDFATLVRGEDTTGNFRHLAGPMRDFDEVSLDLHDRVTEAQEEYLAKGADNFTYNR